MNWKEIQNGSDIRGVAIASPENKKVNLDVETLKILGASFASWLKNKTGKTNLSVAIGMDSRISGPSLSKAFTEGLTHQGVSVIHFGLATTPSMFMAIQDDELGVDGSVMLTASHLPYDRNGLKFFVREGGLDKKDISEILRLAEKNDFEAGRAKGSVAKYNYLEKYSEFLVQYLRKEINDKDNYNQPLSGLHIIVDAGNGAGGFFASKVLSVLGADTSGSQFLDPDGRFPNHAPNPEDPSAVDSLSKAVVKVNADLGIIFDTDVDRAAIINSDGRAINRNELIALISAIILEEHPGSTIVTDSITSEGLKIFINSGLGGNHHRFKRGYKNVINEAKRLNAENHECWLAIETSGHAALKENYFLDDGAFLIAKILVKAARLRKDGKALISLIETLKVPLESEEVRLKIKHDNFKEYGDEVLQKLNDDVCKVDRWEAETENYEGIRVKCLNPDEQGWFLLRLSLHDPVMPLNIESDVKGGVEVIKSKLQSILQNYKGLT